MSLFATVRRKAYTASLLAFRALPGVVRRFLVRLVTPGYTVGAVCAIEHEGRVLFLRQPHRTGWSLPGGLLEHGETPAEGVVREIREETQLRVEVGEPVATEVHPDVGRVDVIFRVRVDQRPDVQVGGEAKAFRWMHPSEVPEVDESTEMILDALARHP
ncbi:MAG TPA: NUDIX domain-containing protein [Segeticoccus sp.]|uniref:NUDIX hydrolase n=1 Tax=Segeticoccus sp. TaxID=2706531 RepID=UPI002D81082F|nr:NUDIX domain-containing protein [Segeticoccus sp.]HET8600149.1 NUDIX domain-containing protein [Segeticoccus sp.]